MKYLFTWQKFNENFGFDRDEISLGSCPKNEESIQAHVTPEYPVEHSSEIDDMDMDLTREESVTDPNYLPKQKQECERYVDMLNKRFVICHNIDIYAKHESYEGSDGYYDAVVKYDEDDTDQKMQAHFIEENLPDTWDDDRVFTHDEYKIWYEDNLDYHVMTESFNNKYDDELTNKYKDTLRKSIEALKRGDIDTVVKLRDDWNQVPKTGIIRTHMAPDADDDTKKLTSEFCDLATSNPVWYQKLVDTAEENRKRKREAMSNKYDN